MDPFIAVAATVFPEILKLILDPKLQPLGNSIAGAVTDAVKSTTKQATPEAAKAALTMDPAMSETLRLQLAQIATEAETKRRQIEAEQAKTEQENRLATLKAGLDADAQKRAAELETLKAGLADIGGARANFLQLAVANSPMAWGAIIVSFVVTVGFFLILAVLIWKKEWPTGDTPVFQLLNITLGALVAAFTTVVSFWMGSSIGSRNKDAASFELQAQQAKETSTVINKHMDRASGSERAPPAETPTKPATTAPGANFASCFEVVLGREGGFTNNPHDPGGPTNWGITQRTLEAWRKEPVSVEDVQNLTPNDAKQIYQAMYWNVLKCDRLPKGVDLIAFDFGVNAGPARSAKLLQRVVGANQDGVIGDITIAAVEVLKPSDIIRRFSELKLEYYKSLPTWEHFGRGWTIRTDAILSAALNMAGA